MSLFLIVLISSSALAEEQFLSPEAVLKSYYKCLEKGDKECVLTHIYGIKNFYIAGSEKPIQYSIFKTITYTEKEVSAWNKKGIIPAAEVGDIQLQVTEIHEKYTGKWSYNFRKINNSWVIISYSEWGQI